MSVDTPFVDGNRRRCGVKRLKDGHKIVKGSIVRGNSGTMAVLSTYINDDVRSRAAAKLEDWFGPADSEQA